MGKTMHLKDIKQYFNDKVLLRPVSEELVEEYALAMKNGAEFPPIRIGDYPAHDKLGSKAIIDGTHTFFAAVKAGKDNFDVLHEKYGSVPVMLADMLRFNMQHGQRVSSKDRNKRIKLLVESGMEQKTVAKEFNLSGASVSRIVAGEQGEGASGPKKGTKKKAKTFLEPREFDSAVTKIGSTLISTKATKSLVDFYEAEGKEADDIEADANKIESTAKGLLELVKLLRQ